MACFLLKKEFDPGTLTPPPPMAGVGIKKNMILPCIETILYNNCKKDTF